MEGEQALGEVLRALRRERGLSQEALALEAGVERNYVSLIELGKNSPSIRILFKLCTTLGVAPSSVLATTEQRMAEKLVKRKKATKER